MTWSADETLASIRVRGDLLDSDARFTDANLLMLINEEVSAFLVPLIASFHSEFFITTKDIQLTPGIDRHFYLPGDAVANRLRLIQYLDANKRVVQSLDQLDPRDAENSYFGGFLGNYGTYFHRGNKVVVLGPIPANWFLRFSYERRVSELVLEADCAQVTDIASNVVTVSSVPATFNTDTIADFVQGSSPWDTIDTQPITNIAGLNITLASVPTSLAEGDFICLTGTAPRLQVPQECIPVLRQYLAAYCNSIKGAEGETQAALALMEKSAKEMRKVLAPRNIGNKKAVGGGLGRAVGGWPGTGGF